MSLAPGSRLGRYEIQSQIGSGGMGEVYLAWDSELDRAVALKILPTAIASDPERMRRFVQEAKSASALNHPNILIVHDVGRSDSIPFMVTEHVEGDTLRARLRKGRLPLTDALDVAIQLAAALSEAHHAGIIHRDIKPENVMVRSGLVRWWISACQGCSEIAAYRRRRPDGGTFHRRQRESSWARARTCPPNKRAGRTWMPERICSAWASRFTRWELATRPICRVTASDVMASVLRTNQTSCRSCPAVLPSSIASSPKRSRRIRRNGTSQPRISLLISNTCDGRWRNRSRRPDPRNCLSERRCLALSLRPSGSGSRVALQESGTAAIETSTAMAAPLTTYPGFEQVPSLSPDGSQVAFSWNGPRQDNYDIYIKLVGPGEPVQLHWNPAPDDTPAWSPNGDRIAFLRRTSESTAELIVMPALRGAEDGSRRSARDIHVIGRSTTSPGPRMGNGWPLAGHSRQTVLEASGRSPLTVGEATPDGHPDQEDRRRESCRRPTADTWRSSGTHHESERCVRLAADIGLETKRHSERGDV